MRLPASVLVVLLGACGGGNEPRTAPPVDVSKLLGAAPVPLDAEDGGTFIWGRSSDAKKLDPAQVTDGESVMVVTNLFDTLVAFEPGTTDIVPWLATKWETSPDSLVWTFTLREDVTFHDTTPLNADAVVFSFERQMREDHPARNPEDVFAYFHDNFKALESVEKVEEFTVRFVLSKPYAPFLSALALFSAGIVSPAAFEGEKKRDFGIRPVGSGPFVFEEWRRDSRIVLRANEDHFSGAPKIDKLIFKPIENPQARLQELRAGGIHGMDNPDLNDLAAAQADERLRLLGRPGINVCYLAMHTQKDPFTDIRVRQAVAYAVDKEALIEVAYNGMAEPAASMCPRSMSGHKRLTDRKVDLVKARKLLADAGYPQGFDTTLWFGTSQRTYLPKPESVAIHIREDLKRVGIRIELRKLEWTAYLNAVQSGEHDMCLLGWMADIFDPDNFLYVLLDKENAVEGMANNVSFYQGERVHKLLLRAQRSYDWTLRERLYHEVQEILFEEVPTLPLVTVPDLRIVRREVRGYTIYPAGGEYFRHVAFEK